MATAKETAAAKTATTPPVPLTLQQKFIKLREDLRRVPASHSGHE